MRTLGVSPNVSNFCNNTSQGGDRAMLRILIVIVVISVNTRKVGERINSSPKWMPLQENDTTTSSN